VTIYVFVTLLPALLRREIIYRPVFLFSLYQFQNNFKEYSYGLKLVVKSEQLKKEKIRKDG